MSDMTALFENMDRMVALHKALYTLAVEKKEILVKGDAEELVRIVNQEQKLIKAVEAAEAERSETIHRLCEAKGLPAADDVTLQDVANWVTNPGEKAKILSYRDELLRIVNELRQANELNQQLLEQSLSFIHLNLELLTDVPENDFTYKPPTQTGVSSASRSFINKRM